jgi:anti-sigma factor RsiW
MKPVPWDWDYLIHRHLAGALTGEQRRALNERLRADARLRRRLAELAFELALIGEVTGVCENQAEVVAGTAAAAPLLKPASPESLARERKARKGKGKKRGKTGGGNDELN